MPVFLHAFFGPAWKSRHKKIVWISDGLQTARLSRSNPALFRVTRYLLDKLPGTIFNRLCMGLTVSDSWNRFTTFASQTSVSRQTSPKSVGPPILDRYHKLGCIHQINIGLDPFLQENTPPFWPWRWQNLKNSLFNIASSILTKKKFD